MPGAWPFGCENEATFDEAVLPRPLPKELHEDGRDGRTGLARTEGSTLDLSHAEIVVAGEVEEQIEILHASLIDRLLDGRVRMAGSDLEEDRAVTVEDALDTQSRDHVLVVLTADLQPMCAWNFIPDACEGDSLEHRNQLPDDASVLGEKSPVAFRDLFVHHS
jgi:hypothetical protein